VISGTPTGTGTSTFTVKVTDAHLLTSTKLLSVTVSAPSWVNSIAATGGTPQCTLIDAAFVNIDHYPDWLDVARRREFYVRRAGIDLNCDVHAQSGEDFGEQPFR